MCCGSRLTVAHILLEFPVLAVLQWIFNFRALLSDVLSDDAKMSDSVLRFIRDGGFYQVALSLEFDSVHCLCSSCLVSSDWRFLRVVKYHKYFTLCEKRVPLLIMGPVKQLGRIYSGKYD